MTLDTHALVSLSEIKEMLNISITPAAPTAALVSPDDPGNVDDGAHSYKVTFVINGVETEGGDISNVITIADKTTNGKVDLTGIATGPIQTTARKIYRTVAGNTGNWLLLATISNNTTTTYTDNTADVSLGAAIPYSIWDARLEQAINDISQAIENYCECAFITRTITNEEHPWDTIIGGYPAVVQPPANFIVGIAGNRYLRLRKAPAISITSIVDEAGNVMDTDLYYLIKKYGVVQGIFTPPFNSNSNITSWLITYVAGKYANRAAMAADLGARDAVRACKNDVALYYRNAVATGALQSKTVGPYSYTYATKQQVAGQSAGFLSDEAKALLAPYRRYSI